MMDVTQQRTFTGRIEAIDTVQIRARVQGHLNRRNFEEGAEVEEGQLLFEIERDSFEIAVEQAEANLASAEAARTLAQQTFNRDQTLVKQKTLSQSALDEAQSALLQAKATVQVREAELQQRQDSTSVTPALPHRWMDVSAVPPIQSAIWSARKAMPWSAWSRRTRCMSLSRCRNGC